MGSHPMKSKSGFGLVEVIASIVVLGLMFSGVMYLQYWNRVAAIRIQYRNEAMTIAKNVIDHMQSQGLSSVHEITDSLVLGRQRDLSTGATATARYTVNVKTTDISLHNAAQVGDSSFVNSHVVSKRVDVSVHYVVNQAPITLTTSAVIE